MTRVAEPGGTLTNLETLVLRSAAEGLTIKATARKLGKSPPAVQDARHRLMGKLGATSLVNAVHLAYQAGIFRRQRHGDHAGYVAHTRRHEPPCDACVQGELDYQRQRRGQRNVNQQQEAA